MFIVKKMSRYTDMTKAFDRINIHILLKKLDTLGIGDHLLSWLQSFLHDRKQYVILEGIKSRCVKVSSGVPQGSHLGPVLFSLYINVINHRKFLLFADDLNFFRRIVNTSDCFLLQADLDAVQLWCNNNNNVCMYEYIARIEKVQKKFVMFVYLFQIQYFLQQRLLPCYLRIFRISTSY
jgi:hypothetical protein